MHWQHIKNLLQPNSQAWLSHTQLKNDLFSQAVLYTVFSTTLSHMIKTAINLSNNNVTLMVKIWFNNTVGGYFGTWK